MKIAVGLSGGVDSAVTAALLKEQGHDVVGIFMKNWSDDFGLKGDCPWVEDQKDAKAVANHLGIEFLSYNFEKQYRERVIQYFFEEYKNGRTPNPDILCNSEIKFNLFLKKCLQELGADKIATGHYARVKQTTASAQCSMFNIQCSVSSEREERQSLSSFEPPTSDLPPFYHLLKGVDQNKDQSYFLCQLTQGELSKSLFPIGEYTKPQVREMAKKLNLPVAEKKDSQGICFVGEINVTEFIYSELGAKRGDIIDVDTGKILGRHKGLWFYTIGQREGLGLSGGPWFVARKEVESNNVYVAKGSDNPALFQQELILENVNVINPLMFNKVLGENNEQVQAEVAIRYRQKPQKSLIYKLKSGFKESPIEDFRLKVVFDFPQRAVAPGQFGCIYVGEEVVASGVIK